MPLTGPNDQDPPWSEGPPDRPETCDACGTECDVPGERERLDGCCGGCGFKWVEIAQAVKVVDAVAKALGVDTGTLQEDKFRAAVEAALSEIVDPELPSGLPGVTGLG